MTNPYQPPVDTPGGLGGPPNPVPFGQPHRTPPYGSPAPGSGPGIYFHRPASFSFSQILNPASPTGENVDADSATATTATVTGGQPQVYPASRTGGGGGDGVDDDDEPVATAGEETSSRNGTTERENGDATNNVAARIYNFYRGPQLPPHSRAFENFYIPALFDGLTPPPQLPQLPGAPLPPQILQRFFMPSYLKGSTYAQRLEDSYRAKLDALRDSLPSSVAAAAAAAASSSSTAGIGIPAQHEGSSNGVGVGGSSGDGVSNGFGGPGGTLLSGATAPAHEGFSGFGSGPHHGLHHHSSYGSHFGTGYGLGFGSSSGSSSHQQPPTTAGGAGSGNLYFGFVDDISTAAKINNPDVGVSGSGSGSSHHRGLAFDVVESHPPSSALVDLEDETPVTPLPSRWNKDDKCQGLEVLGAEGLDVKFSAAAKTSSTDRAERDHEACSIRADHFMPPECGIYYFEVTILGTKSGNETTIGIGFMGKHVALTRAPGWEADSWGYHGDDGRSFASQLNGKDYGPAYNTGDTIGCGVNFRTGCAFFTINGKYLGPAFRDVNVKGQQLFPAVGLKKTGSHVRVNFGQTEFIYAIDAMMENERQAILKEIEVTSTSSLAPPMDETELIQQLVLQFLQHDGYVETARAFAEEIQVQKQALTLDPNELVEGSNVMDDEDANNRQRIRRAILEGDVDRALKYTNAYYPQVLKNNEHVEFRLRCRKFIELIRREAEMNLVDGSSADKRLSSNGVQDMDVDQQPGGGVGASSSSASAAAAAAMPWDRMDTDYNNSGGAGSTAAAADGIGIGNANGSSGSGSGSISEHQRQKQPELRELLGEAIAYGQELQARYSDDSRREVHKTLETIFSLLAYTNPLKEKDVAHMLDRRGRVAVAEELNSAILLSLGKSERSALENLWAQSTVLLEELRDNGGPGCFITLQSVVNDITSGQ